jgi:hypothetical protein
MRAVTLTAIIAIWAQSAMPATESTERTPGQYAKHELGPKPVAMVGVAARFRQEELRVRYWGRWGSGNHGRKI